MTFSCFCSTRFPAYPIFPSLRDNPHPEHWLHNLPETAFNAVVQELKGFTEREFELRCKARTSDGFEHWIHAESLTLVIDGIVGGHSLDATEEFALGQIRRYVRNYNLRPGVSQQYPEDAFDHHVLVAVEMIKRAAVVGEG